MLELRFPLFCRTVPLLLPLFRRFSPLLFDNSGIAIKPLRMKEGFFSKIQHNSGEKNIAPITAENSGKPESLLDSPGRALRQGAGSLPQLTGPPATAFTVQAGLP